MARSASLGFRHRRAKWQRVPPQSGQLPLLKKPGVSTAITGSRLVLRPMDKNAAHFSSPGNGRHFTLRPSDGSCPRVKKDVALPGRGLSSRDAAKGEAVADAGQRTSRRLWRETFWAACRDHSRAGRRATPIRSSSRHIVWAPSTAASALSTTTFDTCWGQRQKSGPSEATQLQWARL